MCKRAGSCRILIRGLNLQEVHAKFKLRHIGSQHVCRSLIIHKPSAGQPALQIRRHALRCASRALLLQAQGGIGEPVRAVSSSLPLGTG
jgi:hypothetical protein